MIQQQFFYQWNEFSELACSRKQHPFFRRKMKLDFTQKKLRDFRLPRR